MIELDDPRRQILPIYHGDRKLETEGGGKYRILRYSMVTITVAQKV